MSLDSVCRINNYIKTTYPFKTWVNRTTCLSSTTTNNHAGSVGEGEGKASNRHGSEGRLNEQAGTFLFFELLICLKNITFLVSAK